MTNAQSDLDSFLQPLLEFETQIIIRDSEGIPCIGGIYSNHYSPLISHADFISQYVPRLVPKLIEKYGRETMLGDLAQMALPLYEKVDVHAMAVFWSRTLRGQTDGHCCSYKVGERNCDLALKYGLKAFFGPMLELAMVHGETRVFDSGAKYFNYHALRMGYFINRFGVENYSVYVEFAKKLLRHGVYDWSAELCPEEWETLAPPIIKYGFKEAYSPIIDAKCALGHIPGANESKYHFSLLGASVRSLMPYLQPRLMKEGPNILTEDLGHIVRFVQERYEEGAFTGGSPEEVMFFKGFSDHLPFIEEHGIKAALELIRPNWEMAQVPVLQ